MMVIAAHPDDAEIAMGGTIAALTAQKIKVVLIDLTNGEPTPYGSVEKRAQESAHAAELLGGVTRVQLDIPNRSIFDTVENRIKLAGVIREYRPKVIFAPYWDDAHPDHWQASSLVVASRFYSKFVKSDITGTPHYPGKVFYYFSTHMRVQFHPTFIFDISGFFDQKIAALLAYKSQFVDHPGNAGIPDQLRTVSAYWGSQAGCAFGEPFVCKEAIKISDGRSIFEA